MGENECVKGGQTRMGRLDQMADAADRAASLSNPSTANQLLERLNFC